MPSLDHEVLLLLFRNRPQLAAELLGAGLGLAVPRYDHAEVHDAELSQIVPAAYHADLVVVLRRGDPVLGVVVEVQLGRDEDKGYSWPLYVAALRARLRCPCCLLVVAADEAVARWAGRVRSLGPGGSVFAPLVLGPAQVPRVTDAEAARAAPELAVLSAQAHGDEPEALEVVESALAAAAGLERERGMLYCDVIWRAAGEALRRQLEERMRTGGYTYQSEFAKRYLAEGRAEGKAEGEAKGRAEGEAKGKAEGRAEALLALLAARGIPATDAQQARVRVCRDLAQLDAWIQHAARAQAADEVFGGE